ncbi:MAG: hypothetical protein L0G59_13685, partial [Kocuria sp.]|nr:hypothetical protein [Kocuria sp.]
MALPTGASSVSLTLRADRGVAQKEYIILIAFDGAELSGPESTPTGLNWSASLKSAFAYTPPVSNGNDGAPSLVELPAFAVPPNARAVELTVVPNLLTEGRGQANFSAAEIVQVPSIRATAPRTGAAKGAKTDAAAGVASVKESGTSPRPQASDVTANFPHLVVAEYTMAVPRGTISITPLLEAERSIGHKEYIIAVSFGDTKITGPESTPRGLSWSRTLKTAFVYSPPVDLADAQKTMPVTLRTIPLPASTQSVTLSIIPAARTKDPAPSPFRNAIIKPVTATSGASNDPPAPSLETLRERFNTDPTPLHLEQLVAHLWNVLGEITRPAALLHQHVGLVSKFAPRAALLARQIADAA